MYKKILILGSGALKIGEAGEFDYSGSQAIKAIQEEWIVTVLVNPNIATVQTNPWFADSLYLVPVAPQYVEEVIARERPDAIMLAFWWQTALNCGLQLEEQWVLERYGVTVLGTSTATIRLTEDREQFNKLLDSISVPYAHSGVASNIDEAVAVAESIGFPVLVRAAFALGGLGSGFAGDRSELISILEKSFAYSHQVIIDESLIGWKELEYEVVRDKNDSCITVCNMENIDPMGIHTGESIVIAPSQTLSDRDHQMLRDTSLRVIRRLDILWECNIQFALDPASSRFCVIEVNARLSRSSALASKVTGYPLAYTAAKIALGYTLDNITNHVTESTSAFFEPSLDYVAVKVPRWDLDKFEKVDHRISSEMKSVWEVMSIGRNIEEALQKAFRSIDIGVIGLVGNSHDFDFRESDLDYPTPKRIFAIVRALLYWKSVQYIHEKTHIDIFFLTKIENIVNTFSLLQEKKDTLSWVMWSLQSVHETIVNNTSGENPRSASDKSPWPNDTFWNRTLHNTVTSSNSDVLQDYTKKMQASVVKTEGYHASDCINTHLVPVSLRDEILELIVRAKKQGFSDIQLSHIFNVNEKEVREFRYRSGIHPKVNTIDTLWGEFPTETNYCYMTYHGNTLQTMYTQPYGRATYKDVSFHTSVTWEEGSTRNLDSPNMSTVKKFLAWCETEKDMQIVEEIWSEDLFPETKLRNKNRHSLLSCVAISHKWDWISGDSWENIEWQHINSAQREGEYPQKVLVIGSGAYRIGSSVEFDWCCVSAVETLKKLGYLTIMLNCNPETVSTDFDSSDMLYFEEISVETITEIFLKEKPTGVIIAMGWQIANNLAMKLYEAGIPILWTDPRNIDRAENRHTFSALLDSLGVDQPTWAELTNVDEALIFWEKYGYPVIIRPSYVLSGANMRICSDSIQLKEFLHKAHISREYPTVISKFEVWAKEIEIDGVAKDGKLELYALSEHIENAWVHSGDATVIFPAQTLHIETVKRTKMITKKIVSALNITGPFNIQFLAKNDDIKVIECNLRASRSFPFVSKVSGYNLIEIAIRAIMGENITARYNTLDLDYVGIKASQSSFHRLKGADPKLGIEMASTGEVWCIGEHVNDALMLALRSTGIDVQGNRILVTLGSLAEKVDFVHSITILQSLGYSIYTTPGTYAVFLWEGIMTTRLDKVDDRWENPILRMIDEKKFDLIINTPSQHLREEESSGYRIRRKAVDHKIPLITNVKLAKVFVRALAEEHHKGKFSIYPYEHFI